MTLFKQKDSQIPASSSSDTKPFISPTVQQMAQRKEESENDMGRNESVVAENSFIKPHVSNIQRKPNSGPDQVGNQGESAEGISEDKQESEQGTSAEVNASVSTQRSTIDEGQEIPDEDAPTEYTFIFADKERSISVNGTELTMEEFSPEEVVAFKVDGTYGGNPPVGYKDQSMGFKLMLLDIMKPDPGDQFTVYFKQSDGRTPVHIIYTMGSIKSAAEAESPSSDGPQQGEGAQSTSEEGVAESVGADSKASTGPYWTHDWRTDRFGNETVFIWEVGSRRSYSNGDKGYEYIRKMATLLPGDTGYDARFERYKRRPQVGEGSSAKLNFWVKRTPGWDNPDHADNGTADFSDLAEFKDSPTNRKGTGFYYMAYVFDPKIYEKLAAQKRQKENNQYIGNHTNYKGFVNAPKGIVLHDTPTPTDEAYNSKRKKEEFIIPQNRPVTVIAEANEANEGWVMVRTANGDEGWIERINISKEPTPQQNELFDVYTVKEGDNLEGLIKSYYAKYPATTGNDRRTVALAIYLYNKDKPGSGVYRNQSKYKASGSWKDYVDPWMQETRANYQSVELYAGGDVILPPIEYIQKMRQLGELEQRPDFVNVMIESGRVAQGFIAGVGIGFWDALVGTGEDLYDMIVDIFTGEIFNQIADMFNMFMEKGLSGIWDMIKDFGVGKWEEVQAAWNNPNPYERGKYFGEIIGMILFEVVLAILTWGIGTAVRNSARVTKILKWFPNINKKKIVPNDVDNYADDIRRANKDKNLKNDRNSTMDPGTAKVDVPQSAKKYEKEIDTGRKKELESEAKQELDNDSNLKDKNSEEYRNKLAALATAKIITEGADLIGLSISGLKMELAFLKKLKGVRDFEFEGSAGLYKVYMIGSKFLVDGKYTESGEGKYRILGKSKNGNVLQAGDSSFGWQHIVEGHVDGKSGKSMFPRGMSKSKIKELVLEASDGPIMKMQGDRIRILKKFSPSKYGISEIELWINKNGNFIETAYPKSGNAVWKFPKVE